MARNNYGFQKRSRELAKKKKKEEKRLRKLAKANPDEVENPVETEAEGQTDVAETPDGTEGSPVGTEDASTETESDR